MATKEITSKSTLLVLNSSQRTSGTPENVHYLIKNPGMISSGYRVVSCSIPYSIFNISSLNNRFAWTDHAAVAHTSVLTSGNYSTADFCTHLQTVMNTDTTDGLVYAVSYSTITTHITIFTTNTFSIQWSSTAVTQQLARDLGFFPAPVITDQGLPTVVNNTGASSYTGTCSYWIGTPRNLYITSNLSGMSSFRSSITVSNSFGSVVDIIANVLVNTIPGEIITWNNPVNSIIPLNRSSTIYDVRFKLLDENFNEISLNGLDWNITIQFYDTIIN